MTMLTERDMTGNIAATILDRIAPKRQLESGAEGRKMKKLQDDPSLAGMFKML